MAHLHSVYDTDSHFSINPITRALKNEASGKVSVIQFDHNSERFTFEIPRKVEDHDMSRCNVIQIHYINIDSQTKAKNVGVYEVDDMQVSPESDDVVILSWLISQNATQLVGSLNFLIRFACVTDGTVDYIWNTAIYSGISVSSGIYNGEVIVEEYADILEQWRQDLIDTGGVTDDRIEAAVENYLTENPISAGSGLSDTAKSLLITILQAGAFKADQTANITALEAALAASGGSSGGVKVYAVINSLSNVTNGNSNTAVVAQSSYSATLTPADGYAIESVTVTMGGEDVTETVWNAETGEITISSVTGDILITATAVESVAAVTSWLYHFDSNLYAAGEKDFGLTLNPNNNNYNTVTYEDGKFGKAFDGYANNYGGGLYAQDLTEYPVLDGDFTIAFWAKNGRSLNNNYVLATTSSNAWPYNKTNIPATLVDTENWTINENTGRSATEGLNIHFNTANITISMVSADETYGIAVNLVPTAGMDVDVWHHYALTRKGETIMFFFDGKMVCTWAYGGELYSTNRIFINCYLNTSAAIINSYNSIDELLIDDESCRYDADFTVPSVPYAG